MKPPSTVAVAVVLAFGACDSSAPSGAARIEQYIQAYAENQGFDGAILIAEDGDIVYEAAMGYADFDASRPNRRRTAFPLASISKLLTATAVLRLVETGSMSLAEPAATYLQEFPYPGITVRHLLAHASGLPPYDAYLAPLRSMDSAAVFTNADFMVALRRDPLPLQFSPGEQEVYNNVNYVVLALLIEQVSGVPYDEYVRVNVLEPADMRDTRRVPLPRPAGEPLPGNFAIPYTWPRRYSRKPIRAFEIPYVRDYWAAYRLEGFGDYASTLEDLRKFDRALADGRLLADSTSRAAYTPVRLTDGTEGSFGLGWVVDGVSVPDTVVYHTGGVVGLTTAFIRNVSEDRVAIVFNNAHYDAYEIAASALAILDGDSVAPPRKSVAEVYGRVLAAEGPAAARAVFERVRTDTVGYIIDEDEINRMGYEFMATSNPLHLPLEPRYEDAKTVFALNLQLFPESWNAYDSYGEALLATGDTASAIEMYEKSLALNPGNANGRSVLQRIGVAAGDDDKQPESRRTRGGAP